jgi:hypothetical protein
MYLIRGLAGQRSAGGCPPDFSVKNNVDICKGINIILLITGLKR